MTGWAKVTLHGAEHAIDAFGMRLRQGRIRAGLSQMTLEARSEVDQSLISRLERGKAPHTSLERIIRLGMALGDDFPLGYCPHDYQCSWRPAWDDKAVGSYDPFYASRHRLEDIARAVHRARERRAGPQILEADLAIDIDLPKLTLDGDVVPET